MGKHVGKGLEVEFHGNHDDDDDDDDDDDQLCGYFETKSPGHVELNRIEWLLLHDSGV